MSPASLAPRIGVLGLSDLLGTGHIDVNVDGKVTLGEVAGNLRVGLIRSRADDVLLTAQAGAIVDAKTGDGVAPTGDLDPDVVGTNITLTALLGIGSAINFLEIDSSNQRRSRLQRRARRRCRQLGTGSKRPMATCACTASSRAAATGRRT